MAPTKALSEKLKRFARDGRLVQVCREELPESYSINGFLIAASQNWILVQESYDFHFLGYLLIPTWTISSVRHGKIESFHQRILKEEGHFPDFKAVPEIALLDAQTVFNSLKRLKKFVRIEEVRYPDECMIGEIIRVNRKSLDLRPFTTSCEWMQKESVRYDEITLVGFDEYYTEVLSKHLPEQPD